MKKERAGQTLQTTALIHEAYLRLAHAGASWQDRRHFFATAATVMRRILVDEARTRNSVKRGGAFARVEHSAAFEFDKVPDLNSYRPGSLVQLDDALTALAQIDARGANVVELRFFGGFSVEETAEVLGVSPQTVMRDWKLAKGWLVRELSK